MNASLEQQAGSFADEASGFLSRCFREAPPLEATVRGSRVRLSPAGQTEKTGGVPLCSNGEQLAWLRVDFNCRLDTSAEFMSIDSSKIWVVAKVDSTPIFRFEYLHDAEWVPHSHIQVHGERGALSHLLTKTGRPRPHNMSALHLPTGGARFRPSLEDVVQFLIADCQFDAEPDWRAAVAEQRDQWRRIQARTVCRDLPEEVATQLERMGYSVTPPPGGHPLPSEKFLTAW